MLGRNALLLPAARCVLAMLAFTLLWTGRADAQWTGFLHINGGVQAADRAVTRTFEESLYGETAMLEATMTSPSGTVVDAWAGVRVWRDVGIGLGATVVNGSGTIGLEGSVPSPLFVGRPREASFELAGLKHQQVGVHLPLVYMVPVSERVHVAVSAGPSWFRLRYDSLAVRVGAEALPYDAVPLTAQPTAATESTAIGYNAALDVTYLLTRWFGAGLYLRYTGATVDVALPGGLRADGPGATASVGLGGVQAGAGFRFRF